MKSISQHLSAPAIFVACVSLVVALGGVSYAAGVLPKNSVGTTQLKKTPSPPRRSRRTPSPA